MLLIEGPKCPNIHPKIMKLIRVAEEVYYNTNNDVPEDIFLVEQLVTLLSNILDNHPELEGEYLDFINQLRIL